MIELFLDTTANGYRAAIVLSECEIPFTPRYIDHHAGENLTPEFVALNPQAAVPVIVDHDGPGGAPLVIAQSGAIALYAAERSGLFLPAEPAARWSVLQWFLHVMTDHVGTNTALVYLPRLPERPTAAITDFESRLLTYFGRVDRRLREVDHLAGEVSIADFALLPIVIRRPYLVEQVGLDALRAWRERMLARPLTQTALAIFADRVKRSAR